MGKTAPTLTLHSGVLRTLESPAHQLSQSHPQATGAAAPPRHGAPWLRGARGEQRDSGVSGGAAGAAVPTPRLRGRAAAGPRSPGCAPARARLDTGPLRIARTRDSRPAVRTGAALSLGQRPDSAGSTRRLAPGFQVHIGRGLASRHLLRGHDVRQPAPIQPGFEARSPVPIYAPGGASIGQRPCCLC